MKLFRTTLTVILVALWPLATGHCRLEQIPGFAFLNCGDREATAAHADDNCATDGCAAVESGTYKTEDCTVGPADPVLLLVSVTPQFESDPPPPNRPAGFLTVAAPEFSTTWQFSFRTALPPRAPSAAS